MKKHEKRAPVGLIIGIVLVGVCVVALANPSLLFFLTPEQQAVLAHIQATYFTAANPFHGTGGDGFDWLRLGAILLLAAEAVILSAFIRLVGEKIKLNSRRAETIKGLLVNCARYAVVIFFLIFALSVLGVNMVAVIASLGLLGLIVGFGAQSLIEDVITGLFIIFEGQFHVGDIITIDNFRGTVTAIGIRTTNLMDAGGNIKIINNSDIRTLTNLSEVASYALAEIGVSYEADLEQAEEAIRELLPQLPTMYPEVFRIPPEYSGVQDLAASSVNLRVAAKVAEPDIYKARRLLLRELKLCLDRANIEIPFPQMVIHQAK